mmetsp:Transcript_27442/g.78982  ORF Transcript_27442/g.78982 Transcript_27442/m.78982 type:complete len:95 (+) Transcript_27442:492-776(+)
MSSGVRYRIVTEGTGRVTTLNDRVKFDGIAWGDAFDGQDKRIDRRGEVCCVTDTVGWLREAVLSMREGEMRRIVLTDDRYVGRYVQLHLVSIIE